MSELVFEITVRFFKINPPDGVSWDASAGMQMTLRAITQTTFSFKRIFFNAMVISYFQMIQYHCGGMNDFSELGYKWLIAPYCQLNA